MRGLNHVVLAVCLWLSTVYGDDKTCQEVKGQTANFHPKLPIEFVVDVEMVIYETATVQNMRLYYSTSNKIIRMDITEDQVTSSMYFYYDDGEILVFNYFTGRGKCRVILDIAKATDDFLFGGLKISDGKSQIPAPLAAVHFIGMSGFQNHQIVQRFQGTKTVRGKQANVYTSCQQWTSKGSNVLLNVTHYFADKKYEFPDVKDETTLLSIDVQGVKTSNVKGESDTPIRHRYNYYNMKIGIENTRDMLETPDGIVCPGRKMDKPFPKLPDRVKLHAESIDHIRKIVVNSEESYNYVDKYAIIKSQPLNTQGSYTTMMDFATDEMYIMSSGKEMCTKVDIKDVPALSELPLYSVKGGKAVMSNPKRFFYADASQFSYLGKKKIRGMLTDAWVAKTKDLANYPNAVIQWHFAPPVKDWNTNHSWAVPMKCIFWPNSQQLDKGITQNIFNADYSHSWMDFYDVSICFKNTKYIRLALNATRADILSTGNEIFREEAAVAIARAVGVRPTKVNQMELLYDKEDVYLDFAISDDSDLKNVTDRLHHAVDTGRLTLNVTDNKTNLKRTITVHEVSSPVVVTPTGNPNVTPTGNPNVNPTGNPNTGNPSVNPTGHSKTNGTNKAERDEGTSGYSGSAMAGVGVAMVIVGLAGGSGLGFMHNKYLR